MRLRDAIINDLIVPFHYYGIRDELVNYGLTDAGERRLIAQISSEENCEFIYQQIESHRPVGQKLKALAFCRNIQHARMMAENLGDYYHTAFLSGKNKTGERIRAYNDLQSENKELEILFAVDILNEGVDIPGVNMSCSYDQLSQAPSSFSNWDAAFVSFPISLTLLFSTSSGTVTSVVYT